MATASEARGIRGYLHAAADDSAFRFDHAVVAVGGLGAAVAEYRRFGFTVVGGGRHAGSPTHNALIALRDGSYLELLATTHPLLPPLLRALRPTPLWEPLLRSRPPLARRFLHHFAIRKGLVDFALATSSLDDVVAAAQARGLAIEGPYAMGRTRPDGMRIEWKLGVPLATDLPFLIEDVTPREQRVPAGPATEHALAVSGVSAILVAVRDLEASLARYRALLSPTAAAITAPEADRRSIFLPDGVCIHLVEERRAHPDGPSALVLAGR
ncbi:MAG: VOC family protein [Gemmatimonadetes bacterium]|nr:VOC family protein [Gemmatimonadota bacterium]